MDPINIIILLNIIGAFGANVSGAKRGLKSTVEVAMDKGTGKSKGFAFVSMPTQEEADKAISMFNEHEMAGNNLKVNIAKPRLS